MLSFILCLSPAYAANVVSVQSVSITPYNEAFRGLESACKCKVKQLVLSEIQGPHVVREVRREKPGVIVAIGSGALEKIRAINDIPIVCLMVLDVKSATTGKTNIKGISLDVPPERQLDIIHQALPDVSDIGLLFNPEHTGSFVEKAGAAARSAGIRLNANEVRNSKDVPVQLNLMTGKIQAFWMLPDVSVVTSETAEVLFLYSLKYRVPVITFSDKYLEMGALMSLEVDFYDMGVQAGEMVAQILSGTDISKISNNIAGKINITINARTARKLGLTVSDEILNRAKVIKRD